jgi:uncharacterized hydrophobic protein (TIGR00271 family)
MTSFRERISMVRRYTGWRIRRITGDWHPYLDNLLTDEELDVEMERASLPTYSYFALLTLSSAIATFGLLADSAPAIIGAMIIAPLMAPILSLAHGIITLDWPQTGRSIMSVASGTLVVILFAYLSTEFIGLRIAGSEILSRTSPSLLDLGVAIAAGAAAALAYTRESIRNSIAGVAIAVALVPPLAVTGVGMALGRRASADAGLSLTELGLYSGGVDIASGAFILFLTNLAGIVLVAALVLLSQGYGQWKKAIVWLVLIAAASAILLRPLGESLHRLYAKTVTYRAIGRLMVTRPDIFSGEGRIDSLNVTYRDDLLYVDIDALTPRERLGDRKIIQEKADLLRDELMSRLGEPVVIELEMVALDYFEVRSVPDLDEGPDEDVPQIIDDEGLPVGEEEAAPAEEAPVTQPGL